MEFEGVEKKLEIKLNPSFGSLLELEEAFWHKVVEDAKASILSRSTTEQCKAYLLSESSLFIFESRLVMITCGTTTLVEAALNLLKKISRDKIEFIFYERKNENFPQHQSSNHIQDIKQLESIFNGHNIILGKKPKNHVSLFHFALEPVEKKPDTTIEILMHDLAQKPRDFFSIKPQTINKEEVRKKLGLKEFFPAFQMDDHIFSPQGYSLNAIKKSKYYTVHVTPNSRSYASFETNHHCMDKSKKSFLNELIKNLVYIFEPKSFNLLIFSNTSIKSNIKLKNYTQTLSDIKPLAYNYKVYFYDFEKDMEKRNE